MKKSGERNAFPTFLLEVANLFQTTQDTPSLLA